MNFLMESIEHEMGEAFEVKNQDSLRRCALLLAENMVTRAEYTAETGTLHEDIREILTEMRVRFDAVEQRFEASDKKFEMLHEEINSRFNAGDKKFELLHEEMNSRFDASDKRFEQMFRFQTLTVTILALLITVFKFL